MNLNTIMRQVRALCRPARFYVTLSVVSTLLILVQNLIESRRFCLGSYSCKLPFNNLFVFLGKALYVVFWTIVLDSLCKNGYEDMSWILVLFPFILMFIGLGLFMFAMITK